MDVFERDEKRKEEKLLQQISTTNRDQLYCDYAFKDFKKRLLTIDRDNRTDAHKHILTLLELIDEQIAKHNGILKRKVGTLEKKLNKLRYHS